MLRSTHTLAQQAVDARSELREAWHAQRTAWDIARHYRDEIVPAAKRISDEDLLHKFRANCAVGGLDGLATARLLARLDRLFALPQITSVALSARL